MRTSEFYLTIQNAKDMSDVNKHNLRIMIIEEN